MNTFQSILIYLRVELGRGDIGMSQHHLYGPQIGPIHQQMGGKGMPEHMGGDVLFNPCRNGYVNKNLPETQTGHCLSPGGDEQEVGPLSLEDQRPCLLQICLQTFLGGDTKGDEALLVAFADNPDETSGQIAPGNGQANKLGDPEACRIQEAKHRIIPQDKGWGDRGDREQTCYLVGGQGLGQGAAGPGQINGNKGIMRDVPVGSKKREKGL